jgi:hypothetical protein
LELEIPFYGPGMGAPADVSWSRRARHGPYAERMYADGMYYTRGSKDDYDGYAKLSGEPGWHGIISKNTSLE